MSSSQASLIHMVILFWIVLDSPGTLPIFVNLLKHFDPAKQRKIIVRELLIALLIMIIFFYFGNGFFKLLHITTSSTQIAGGIILFMLAIKMIFSTPALEQKGRPPKDPLIVPLAVPLIAGPGILATLTLYAGMASQSMVLLAIFIAWALSLPLLLFSPILTKTLGDNGIAAIERLFGYILILISSQMAISGLSAAFK